MTDWPWTDYTELAKKAEMFETDPWCVPAILDREILTHCVIDPCVGRGVMAQAARNRGHAVHAIDKYDWGFEAEDGITYAVNRDFLGYRPREVIGDVEWTAFMNPPFSLATRFVEHGFDQGARKVVMFQRFAFYESAKRTAFWQNFTPARIYVCAQRADCWRIDIAPELRNVPKDKGGAGGGTPVAHAWFIFEPGHPGGPVLGRVSKGLADDERENGQIGLWA